jgi:hypothetical protein
MIEDKHVVCCVFCGAELITFYVDVSNDQVLYLAERLQLIDKATLEHACPKRQAFLESRRRMD